MRPSGAIYIGEPHKVAAITPSSRNRAKPKSAIFSFISVGNGFGFELSWQRSIFWKTIKKTLGFCLKGG
jgi:hypothetical protein